MNYRSPFSFAIPQQEEVPYLDSLRQNATKRRDPREEDIIRAVERKVQEAILRDYQAPEKPTSLEDIPQAFGEGLGEGLGSLAQYAVSPQGKQITAALIGQSNPHLAKGFYTSGLQEQKNYNARLAAYQQARERQGKGALDYLKFREKSKKVPSPLELERFKLQYDKSKREIDKERKSKTIYPKIYNKDTDKFEKSKTPVMAYTKEDAKKIRELNTKIAPLVGKINKIMELRLKKGRDSWGADKKRAQQLATEVRANFKELYGLGVLSESDIEKFIDPSFPQDPLSVLVTDKTVLSQMEGAKNLLIESVENANIERLDFPDTVEKPGQDPLGIL